MLTDVPSGLGLIHGGPRPSQAAGQSGSNTRLLAGTHPQPPLLGQTQACRLSSETGLGLDQVQNYLELSGRSVLIQSPAES